MTSDFMLAPYGVPPRPFQAKGLETEIVMAHWRPELSQEKRIETYNAWRDDRLTEITEALWPRFDYGSRQFVGSATAFAEALTQFELGLMIEAFFGDDPILTKTPSSPLARDGIETHARHYVYEDEDPPGFNYKQYDRTLTVAGEAQVLAQMLAAITTDVPGTKAAGHFWFKTQLQRPRPLHAALAFGLEDDFRSETSARGQHPSIVSGHCFQGIMMGCAVLEYWQNTDPSLADDRRTAMQQYMIDVGDRRVFAGVHYPTDNVASWVLALALIPEVFEDGMAMQGYVRDAILRGSAVHDLIVRRFAESEAAAPALALLKRYGLGIPAPAS